MAALRWRHVLAAPSRPTRQPFMPALSRRSTARRPRRGSRRLSCHDSRRRLLVEPLEDRRLLAVSFEFNYLGGNSVGFNDPVSGAEFRSALEDAANRLGGWLLHDATIQMDVASDAFNGQSVAQALSAVPPAPPQGGFVPNVITGKVLGETDANGSASDGELGVFFFAPSDTFSYVTDPSLGIADDELDFQALVIHELAHTIGFTSATNVTGSDDSGGGINTPGTWRPFDRFLSDASGNRLIDADPQSPTAFRMDTSTDGWPTHSVGGKGPDAGLFFSGPIATEVFGGPVPLYSPASFSLVSSVSHLDSEGAPDNNPIFTPQHQLMSHAIIDRAVPQELTLVEKAIFADIGVMFEGIDTPTPDFIVTTLDDELDANPESNPADLSLREAISLANATAGSDLIYFSLPGSGSILLDPSLGQLQITESVSIVSPGRDRITVDAQGNSRVIDITPSAGDVVLKGLTVTGGSLVGDDNSGAGVRFQSAGTLTITDSTLSNNSTAGIAAVGGAIQAISGDLQLTDTIVSGNSTNGDFSGGGGIWTGGGNVTLVRSSITGNRTTQGLSFGGGMYVLNGSSTIIQSTISGNQTNGFRSGGGGVVALATDVVIRDSTISGNSTQGSDSKGGGIRLVQTRLDLTNSTISGNSTQSTSSDGGGIFAKDSTVNVENSTISLNQSAGAGGGIGILRNSGGTTITIANSILAANLDDGTAPDLAGVGSIANAGAVKFSLIGDNTGSSLGESQSANPTTGSIIGDPNGGGRIDPALLPLSDNGGLTQTHLPGSSSPAIDAGDPLLNRSDFSPPLNNDQRGDGFVRISSSRIDIGAVESAGSVTITWNDPADIQFGDLLNNAQLNAFADVPGSFVYTPAAGTRLDAGEMQPISAIFTPDDTGTFDVTTATVFINVLKVDPVITWPNPAEIVFGTPLGATQLNATTNVAGTFVYSSPLGTVLDAGENQVLSVTFTPIDTRNFNVQTTSALIDVTRADPVIVWSDPAPIFFGTPLGDGQLNATANTDGTFSYVPPPGVLLRTGENQTLTVTFIPQNTQNFTTQSATVTIDVLKADPAILWDPVGAIVVGTPLGNTQLDATTSVFGPTGTFVYTPSAGTVLGLGDGQTLSVAFTPDDTANYNPVTATNSIDVVDVQDYGDAPSQYPVTLADNGARHSASSLTLGSAVDLDVDGQPSILADGDGADDDGIALIAGMVAAVGADTTSSLSAEVSEAGKLDGWIDFNQDGDWDDPGEQVITSADVLAGINTLSYNIPDNALAGVTAARLRLSSSGGLAPGGPADDGEVEDYLFTLLDGSNKPDVSVRLVGDSLAISTQSGKLIVRDGGVDLFAAPQDQLGVLQIVGTFRNETVSLESVAGAPVHSGGLNLQGGNGDNRLRLLGEAGFYDFTDDAIVVQNFSSIDLSSVDSSSLIIDASAVNEMSPIAKAITIVAGEEDSVVVSDAVDWRMTAPVTINGRFVRTATNGAGSNEVVQLDAPHPWQNFLQTGDVNNDGVVTARDALRIINELGRRQFSGANSQLLQDPQLVAPWPGVYFDHNGDGRATALDALRVINDLARRSVGGGEGESIQPDATRFMLPGTSQPLPDDPGDSGNLALVSDSVSDSALASRERLLTTLLASSGDRMSRSGAHDAPWSTTAISSRTETTARRSESSPPSSAVSNVDELLSDAIFLDRLFG